MINRLIDMKIPIVNQEIIDTPIIIKNNFTIKDYATSFINGMGETQRNRFKKMLENGIKCGMSVADNYDIDYTEFIKEVKKQMGVI